MSIKNPKSRTKGKMGDLIALLIASQMGRADEMAKEIYIRDFRYNLDKIINRINENKV